MGSGVGGAMVAAVDGVRGFDPSAGTALGVAEAMERIWAIAAAARAAVATVS